METVEYWKNRALDAEREIKVRDREIRAMQKDFADAGERSREKGDKNDG